mgnify:CR=1 FL=1
MKWFLREIAKENGLDKKISMREDRSFAALIPNDLTQEIDTFYFEYNIDDLLISGADYKNGAGYVTANMTWRAPYMRGFSQVTRILLHEFGHQMTCADVLRLYGGAEEMAKFYRGVRGNQARYVQVPAEWVATQWAIMWLADPEHRKIAKQVEKRFWACFD